MLVSSSGSSASPFGFVGKAGYQEDGDSTLKLLGHRYYDVGTGRFLSRDRKKDGRNRYVYGGSRPSKCIDPTGYENWFTEWMENIYFYHHGEDVLDANGNPVRVGGYPALSMRMETL